MHILWTIIIGFIVGVIAKFIMPGDKTEPKGFILTAILGIVGAFVATYLGQAVGWYAPGESAGFIGGYLGEPVDVVACETVALDVPATSEIVLEGTVSPEETAPEGPMGEYSGYLSPGGPSLPNDRLYPATAVDMHSVVLPS